MQRYEYSEGSSNKFWEISLEGTSFTTRFGRIGTDGQTSTKTFKSDEQAKREHDKIVAEKVKKGYVPVGGGGAGAAPPATTKRGKGASNPELEAAILADPDSVDGYLVYGDWLSEQGDPRGELIAVQARLAESPDDATLKQKESELLAAHQDDWIGEFLGNLQGEGEFSCTWRYGFFEKVEMGGDEWGETNGVEAWRALSKLASAKFLRDLTLAVFDSDEGTLDYGGLIKTMAKSELPPLRRLAFDCKGYQISWAELGNVSPLYPQLMRLEELFIKMGPMDLGKMALPALRKLEVVTGSFSKKNLKSVATAPWPNLEALILYFGDDNYGGDCDVADVTPILGGGNIPKVKHLGLCNSSFADALAAAVAKSKVLARLEHLDLSQGTLGEEGARAILDNAQAFSHLKSLNLTENYIPEELCEQLSKVCAQVIVEDQGAEEDPDDRYVQISE